MSQAPRCQHGRAERGIHCAECHAPPSSTPRTDAASFCAYARNETRPVVLATFARQLERELAQAQAELALTSEDKDIKCDHDYQVSTLERNKGQQICAYCGEPKTESY